MKWEWHYLHCRVTVRIKWELIFICLYTQCLTYTGHWINVHFFLTWKEIIVDASKIMSKYSWRDKLVRNYGQMRVLSFPGDEKSGGRWWKECFRSSSMSRPTSCESWSLPHSYQMLLQLHPSYPLCRKLEGGREQRENKSTCLWPETFQKLF